MIKNWTKKITKNKGLDYLVYRPAGGGTIEIFDIAVMSKREQGIGTSMINELINKERPGIIHAITRSNNEVAVLFYKKLGFEGVVLERFYKEGDAIIFIKNCY